MIKAQNNEIIMQAEFKGTSDQNQMQRMEFDETWKQPNKAGLMKKCFLK